MGGGAGGQQRDSSTSFRPWKEQAPYLKALYKNASELPEQQYYPGSTVAPQDQASIDALKMTEARARAGNPLLGQSQDYTSRVLGGEYLNANPYLDQTYDRAAQGVARNFNLATLPALETRFATSGRSGGGAYGNALGQASRQLGDSLSGLATDIYGGNYARERGVMDTAAGRAPGLAAADYEDSARLGGVGATREAFSQTTLDDLVNRFNFGQDAPINRLQTQAGLYGQPVGGSTTTYRGGEEPGWLKTIKGFLGK
jgi:hypothetical protein